MTQNKLKKFSFILANITMIGCLTSCGPTLTQEQKAVYKVVNKFSKKFKKELDLHLFGQGESNRKGMHAIHLAYASEIIPLIGTARELIVNINSNILNELNSNKSLEKVSQHFPYTLDNLSIGILFTNVAKTDTESITMVLMTNEQIFYSVNDPLNGGFKTIYEENFKDALEIVNN